MNKKRKVTSSNRRDLFIIVAVVVVVVGGYLVLKAPSPKPEPPQAANPRTGVAGMDQAMTSSMANFPTDYNSLVRLGNEQMDQKNFAVAAEAYRRALAIDGSDVDVRTDYGACLHGMGLPNRAIDEFRKVITADPRHAIAHMNMGIVYYNIGQVDSARVYWNRVLEIEPSGDVSATAKEYLKQIAP